jgi:hypothetical protein
MSEIDNEYVDFTVIESFAGEISTTVLPLYETEPLAKAEALREIQHRMLTDHTDLSEDDREIYEEAQQQIIAGITSVTLPDLGDGCWTIDIRPIKKMSGY